MHFYMGAQFGSRFRKSGNAISSGLDPMQGCEEILLILLIFPHSGVLEKNINDWNVWYSFSFWTPRHLDPGPIFFSILIFFLILATWPALALPGLGKTTPICIKKGAGWPGRFGGLGSFFSPKIFISFWRPGLARPGQFSRKTVYPETGDPAWAGLAWPGLT